MSSLSITKKNRGASTRYERRLAVIETTMKATHRRLAEHAQKFAQIDQCLDGLETKVDTISRRLDGIELSVKGNPVNTEHRIAKIEDNISGILKYIKLEADFQEQRNKQFISKLYLYNIPSSIVTSIDSKKIYDHMGKELTDLDGFLLISNIPRILPQLSTELVARIPSSISLKGLLKEGTPVYDPELIRNEYIIIESKHSLSKAKIDKKLRQIQEIRDMLQHVTDVEYTSAHELYRTCIEKMVRDTGLARTELNHIINVIFSSDDIPQELIAYITAIDSGITEEQYERITLSIFFGEHYLKKVINFVLKNNKIPKHKRDKLDVEGKLDEIRKLFKDPEITSFREVKGQLTHIHAILVPFSTMESYFHDMKGKLGVLQFNTVTMPRLFQKSSLNHVQ